jgi:hypothetical protein
MSGIFALKKNTTNHDLKIFFQIFSWNNVTHIQLYPVANITGTGSIGSIFSPLRPAVWYGVYPWAPAGHPEQPTAPPCTIRMLLSTTHFAPDSKDSGECLHGIRTETFKMPVCFIQYCGSALHHQNLIINYPFRPGFERFGSVFKWDSNRNFQKV